MPISQNTESNGKKQNVMSACYDKYTQEDVNEYHNDVAGFLKNAAKNGNLREAQRRLCREDLYYLLTYALDIKVMYSDETDSEINFRPWLFNRCREVMNEPDFHVDIWARGHFKSTIITLGKTIQDILNNPEIAICIYSYNKTIAQSFVSQIRANLENSEVKRLFPDIIPENPGTGKYLEEDEDGNIVKKKNRWSDESFTVKRKTNRKEPTVSGYGLVNAQPTGMHFDLLVYDDVVTPDSVRSQIMNEYTYSQWQMSLNTGSGESTRIRIIGTRYHSRDAYFHILNPHFTENGELGGSKFSLRVYPCFDEEGNTVLYTKDYIEEKRRNMMGFVFSSQMLCNPQDGDGFRFLEEWIPKREKQEDIERNKDKYNFYIIVDPANTKKKSSDFTSMVVIASTSDKRYIVADLVYDKLYPAERRDTLFSLVSRWTNSRVRPTVFYESNGMAADWHMINEKQKESSYFFNIVAATTKPRLRPDQRMAGEPLKMQRIMALEPVFREGRIIFCENTTRKNWQGQMVNTTQYVLDNEYREFPNGDHDDFLDSLARIADLDTGPMILFPKNSDFADGEQKPRRSSSIFEVSKRGYIPF
nr:MAG TPA: Terminase [Bacteriophage sp.]